MTHQVFNTYYCISIIVIGYMLYRQKFCHPFWNWNWNWEWDTQLTQFKVPLNRNTRVSRGRFRTGPYLPNLSPAVHSLRQTWPNLNNKNTMKARPIPGVQTTRPQKLIEAQPIEVCVLYNWTNK